MRKLKTGRRKRKPVSPEKKIEKAEMKEWRLNALRLSKNKCEWCGATKFLNVHHIIGRRYKPLKTSPFNSMVLCARCHKFGVGISAHENPIKVMLYLEAARPVSFEYLKGYTREYLGGIKNGVVQKEEEEE